MLDALQKCLQYAPQEVSPDAFHDWKQHPATQELLNHICEKYMEDCTSGLPLDPSLGTPYAQRIEGSRTLLEIILNWEPSLVEAIKAGDGEDE